MRVLKEIDAEFEERDYSKPREIQTEIKIENLSVRFEDKNGGEPVTALSNINLDINQGEFISLLGPSGCGKTTLLRIIADLLQPTEGKITVRGETPRSIRLQKKYGIVF